MRANLLHVITWSLLLFMSMTAARNDDGKAGATGAPGEDTCVECHDTSPLNSGPGSVMLASPDLVNWTYVPGTTYTLELTVAESGRGLFGMGLVALDGNGANAGMLNITDPNSTRIRNALVNGNNRRNVVHELNGGTGAGSKTFTFTWTAPATDIGPVTFYYAGNAADGDGDNTGDHIYSGSEVASAGSVGLAEAASAGLVGVFPNPAHDRVMLNWRLPNDERVQVQLLDLQGRVLAELSEGLVRSVDQRPIGGLDRFPESTYLLAWRSATASGATPLVIAR